MRRIAWGYWTTPPYRTITKRQLGRAMLPRDEKLTGAQIRVIRESAQMSQGVFAQQLRISVGYVAKLERGEAQASGPALTLLNVIRRTGIEVRFWRGCC